MTGVHVREADLSDIPALCALFADVFGRSPGQEEWRWKYHDAALPAGVNVVLERAGELLGHAGAIVLDGVHDGRPVKIAQVGDVMLAPRARGLAGPGGAYAIFMSGLIELLQARHPGGMFFGFPGVRPFRLGERLGLYRGTGEIESWQLDCQPQGLASLRVVELDWETPRLDALWARHAGRPGVWCARTRSYLDWRYRRHPRFSYALLGLRLGRIPAMAVDGWAVVRREGGTLTVIDRLIDESLLVRALGAISAWAARQGCCRLVFWPGREISPLPGALRQPTGMVGVVMPSSASAFDDAMPMWQPGDTDVF